MSLEDAEDVCFARYALELASLDGGFGPYRKDLVRSLRLALDHMSVAARTDDLDALVASDTLFHEVLVDVSGRRRLKDLWSMLNSQMGALMRAGIDRQGISLDDAVERHRGILEAVTEGDLDRLRRELRVHYMTGFPDPEPQPTASLPRPDRTGDS
jgi:DNA-binding GntR family transcriptional regulator